MVNRYRIAVGFAITTAGGLFPALRADAQELSRQERLPCTATGGIGGSDAGRQTEHPWRGLPFCFDGALAQAERGVPWI